MDTDIIPIDILLIGMALITGIHITLGLLVGPIFGELYEDNWISEFPSFVRRPARRSHLGGGEGKGRNLRTEQSDK